MMPTPSWPGIRRRRFHGPVALGGMDVGVTQTAGLDTDQDLAWPWLGHRDLSHRQWTAELGHDCCLHGGTSSRERENRAPLLGIWMAPMRKGRGSHHALASDHVVQGTRHRAAPRRRAMHWR